MTAEFDALMNIVQHRRSIRRFRPQPVEKELIEKLMDAARWAPSAGNLQNFRFLAVTRSETIEALADAVRQEISRIRTRVKPAYQAQAERYAENFLFFATAPLLIVPMHRPGPNLLNTFCDQPIVEDKEMVANAHASVAAAIMNLLLAAQALGLGACWMTGPLVARAAMVQLLKVPPGWEISALVPVGYADESPPAPKRRSMVQILKCID